MARGRMISKSLSTSKKWNSLTDWFARSLYLMLIVHADDYGIVDGDPQEIKWKVLPAASESADAFDRALDALVASRLIYRYSVGDHTLVEIIDFDPHQQGLHKRTERKFPAYADTQQSDEMVSGKFQEIPGSSEKFPLNIKEYKRIRIGIEGEGEGGRGTQPVGCSPAPTHTVPTVPPESDKPKRSPSTSGAKRTIFPPNQQDLETSCLSWASVHANGIDARAEFERFADYHRGKGSLMADWQAAWRNWYRKAKEYADAAPTKRPRDNVPPMWHTLRQMYPEVDTEEGGEEP